MSFMDNLANNPGGSGIYGSNNTPDNFGPQDALNLVFQLKDRENRDFEHKANFMSDLSLKQDRMRNLFNPNKQEEKPQMNTVMAKDPNQMTGYEKGELDVKRQGLGIDKQRLAQQGKIGQGALDIKQQQADLAQQKSDQINATKQADMERKINESTKKFELAQAELDRKTKAGEDTLQAHKDVAAAIEERHKLEMAQKDTAFQESKRLHDAQIKDMEDKAKNSSESETTTEINPEGTKKTVTTNKGGTVQVIGKDGKSYTIPKNKLDDWNKNHKGGE